ncbi:MAG: PrsW family glutamic-type intramembrane protease [bacterium]|nr:PrsW family glutamic-type intramembrane protease [bacterium]
MVISLILLGLIPSFAWLVFFLKEDVHPEPKKMIAKVFMAGALMTIFAAVIQFLLQKIFISFSSSFFVFAVIEEFFKFLTVYLVVRKSRFFDEPIDAMIYMITAALGFAMVENIAVALNASNIQEAIGAMTLRFVGATLLHALTSGIVGYYWAKGLIVKSVGHWSLSLVIVKGLIIASLLHMIFNYLILISKEQILIYPTIFLIIIALFVFWDFERIKTAKQTQN